MTVQDLIHALEALPADARQYDVLCDAEPGELIDKPRNWFVDEETKQVYL